MIRGYRGEQRKRNSAISYKFATTLGLKHSKSLCLIGKYKGEQRKRSCKAIFTIITIYLLCVNVILDYNSCCAPHRSIVIMDICTIVKTKKNNK